MMNRKKLCLTLRELRCASAAMGSDWAGNVGGVAVAELDWAAPEHAASAGGPFDVVLAADCVYHEEVVRDFLRTVLALVDHRSTGGQQNLVRARMLSSTMSGQLPLAGRREPAHKPIT